MKAITSDFKNALKGIKEVDAKVTYTLDSVEYELGMEELNSIQPHYNADILKSVMKELELDSNVDIPKDTIINYQFGVKVRSGKNLFDSEFRQGSESSTSSTTYIFSKNDLVLPSGTYTFSSNLISGFEYAIFGTTSPFPNSQTKIYNSGWKTGTTTFTITQDLHIGILVRNGGNNLTPSNVSSYQFQLEKGSQATSYEQFGAYDYVNYGNYIVYSSEKQEDTNSYLIKCYDKMLYSMVDYETPTVSGTAITYPITVQNYLSAICSHLGLTLKSSNFVNYNKVIPSELYLDKNGKSLGYKFRDILDELAQVTASTICINENDDQLEVRYANETQGKNLVNYNNMSEQYTNYTFENDTLTINSVSGTYNCIVYDILDIVKKHPGEKIKFRCDSVDLTNNTSGNICIVQLQVTNNGTNSWPSLANKNTATSLTLYDWTIPNDTSNLTLVRVRIFTNNSNTTNTDSQTKIVKPLICFDSETDDYEPFGDTIDEEFFDETNVKFGELYGPINTIVLSRSADSDNYTKSIPTDLADNLKNAIKISDNQIMNFDNRSEYADNILNKLNGLSYYTCDYSSKGIFYYNVCDKYNASIFGTFYNCIMLNDDVKIEGGIKENVSADIPKQSETDYSKATSDDVADRKTKLIVDKANQTITSEISGYEKVKAIVIGTYGFTTDVTFKADKTYYISNGENQYEEYTNYSVGDTVPANTIYELTGSKIQELSGQYSTLDSKIDKTKADITDEYEKYYESQIKQTKDSIEFDFNEKYSDYDSMDAATNGRINEIQKYLRYIRSDNSVRLGMNTDNMELVLKNNRMAFYDKSSGQEVAYISENKLYITNAQILTQIQIGNFAFVPRSNGSLGFRKVS